MPNGSCDRSCQRWVSGCVLARVDAAGVEREISIRGLQPGLAAQPLGAGDLHAARGDLLRQRVRPRPAQVPVPAARRDQRPACLRRFDDGCPMTVVGSCGNDLPLPGTRSASTTCAVTAAALAVVTLTSKASPSFCRSRRCDRPRPRGPLSAARPSRRGRDGGGLPRARSDDRGDRRRQDPGGPRRPAGGPLRPGGDDPGGAGSPGDRPLRQPTASPKRRPLHRDGVDGRRGPGHPAGARAPLDRRDSGHRPAHRRGAGPRPRQGRRSPRHQARQPVPARRRDRSAEGARLRHRPADQRRAAS